MMDSKGKTPRRGRTTRGKGRRIRGKELSITLNSERDPVLTNMTRGEVKASFEGILWDLIVAGKTHRQIKDNPANDTQEAYTKAADELTVILRLVDRARDHALELSVRPVEDEVGTDA